ncbi:hypothetical protein SESBI_35191 [Sesbania bispinosa]|nr:hypothetical protein SESBI_35191 [Sesbania bispinosa]
MVKQVHHQVGGQLFWTCPRYSTDVDHKRGLRKPIRGAPWTPILDEVPGDLSEVFPGRQPQTRGDTEP